MDSASAAGSGNQSRGWKADAQYWRERARAEEIANEVRARHERLRKLVLTWMPYTEEELEQQANQPQISQKEEEQLLFRPDRAGLGAEHLPPGRSDVWGLGEVFDKGGELEKIRKQLLGKKADAKRGQQQKPEANKQQQSRSNKNSSQRVEHSSEDSGSDGGRSSVFKSKRSKPMPFRTAEEIPAPDKETAEGENKHSIVSHDVVHGSTKKRKTSSSPEVEEAPISRPLAKSSIDHSSGQPSKRSHSFLDEVLTQKSKKKRQREETKRKKEDKNIDRK